MRQIGRARAAEAPRTTSDGGGECQVRRALLVGRAHRLAGGTAFGRDDVDSALVGCALDQDRGDGAGVALRAACFHGVLR